MDIRVAKTAGFCFGVARAVDRAYQCAEEDGKKYCTLGPIIHNAQVVSDLAEKGVGVIDSLDNLQDDVTVIIRTHGVPKSVYQELENRGIPYLDLTCPFVKKIHTLVSTHHAEGCQIIIIGDSRHPEVIGINGWCDNSAIIIENLEQAEALLPPEKKVCIVAQTTFNKNIYKKIIFFLKKTCQNTVIFDTICNATEERQAESQMLAGEVDVMVVLGGQNSSNTQKLYQICKGVCPEAYCAESIEALGDIKRFQNKRVGITAGASTPAVIIKEAINKMENQDKDFATLLEESLKAINTGDIVTGTVIEVGPTEVIVDLGVKQDGVIPASEISDDPSLTPEDIVKVGDEIQGYVVRVNDVEGKITLSKKRLDSFKTWDAIEAARENGDILEGKVDGVVNGGIIVTYKSFRVFVPASLANDRYLTDLNELVGKTVPFKVLEINKGRKRIVGNIKTVLMAQKQELEKAFWEAAEVGKKYTGIVKSLTSFGAFVDIGGVDGLVHISELSWARIKHPSDVVSVGDSIEVYIKDIAEDTKKISLGYKNPLENPWEIAKSKLNVGDVVSAKIVRMLPFGAFAEIMPTVDGLIHISQIANKRIGKPQDELSIGQEVDVKIVDIDWENKKIALSIRALLPVEEPVVEEAPAVEAEDAEPTSYTDEVVNTIGDAVEAPATEE
ncbi:MAG: bifunctional 4-hydroxy-3-methylbut-2-enyl diphosphate reductase/30S ribosomal protein S1 [Ruminococcaceae bacterium]|nr:bifunctional 4-hydroxy-3-methylbut-2-enyl diphosphate reductase/30S ribosomal protein S1 [Oscillospiraceae bacterium]